MFRLDVPCLNYAKLGDSAVRALAIHHLIEQHALDALVVPTRNPRLRPLFQAVFGEARLGQPGKAIPRAWADATVSAPTGLDWRYASRAWNVFECAMWEQGFFNTSRIWIVPPVLFRCDPRAKAALVYPAEGTDRNRVYGLEWWTNTCRTLRDKGYAIHHLGAVSHLLSSTLMRKFGFAEVFPPSIQGLRDCVASSSLAIGGSTGPSWVLLCSNVRQIVLESRRSPHGYWFFDRCQDVLAKKLTIVPTLDCMVPTIQ